MNKNHFINKSQNNGFILLLINVFLLIVLFFVKDPWGWFESNYSSTNPFVKKNTDWTSLRGETVSNGKSSDKFSIIINGESDSFVLYREEGKWNTPISKIRWKEWMTKIEDLRPFTPLGNDKDKYGFSSQEHRFHLSSSESDSNFSFSLSPKTDKSGGSYIMVDDVVYLLPFSMKEFLTEPVWKSFISPSFLPDRITNSDILSVELLENEKTGVSYSKLSDVWLKNGSTEMKADTMENLFSQWKETRVKNLFPNKEPSWKRTILREWRWGFEKDGIPKMISWRCNLQTKEGDPVCVSSEGDGYYQWDSLDWERLWEKNN